MVTEITNSTIAAIATPLGEGGVGIIRVSGPNSLSLLQFLTPLREVKPRYFYVAPLTNPTSGDRLDEAGCLYFKGPHSYTGEDVLEIHLHSSPFILKTVLNVMLENGAELATAGEFTRRAFVNGKLDLTKAESVIDLIHSSSDRSHSVALSHLQGALYSRLMDSRALYMSLLEQVEASIDFPDEVEPVDKSDMKVQLASQQEMVNDILSIGDYGPIVRSGVKVLIVGQPNVGKSSLMNALLGHDRAIVTEIAGTTRDFISETIQLGGVQFHLYDTAGIRETDDYVEQLGMQKISELMDTAHLILFMVDATNGIQESDMHVYNSLPDHTPKALVINKIDHSDIDQIPQELSALPTIRISAQTTMGLDELKSYLYTEFVSGLDNIDLDLLCNARQLACLKRISTSLATLQQNIDVGVEDDLLSIELKSIIQDLGEITGDEVTEEVLDGIFSRFCVGK